MKLNLSMMAGETVYSAYCGVRSNSDVFDRIRYLHVEEMHKETHIIATVGKKIVGVIGMQESPYNSEIIWIKFISVDPAYRNRGICKRMMSFMFDWFDILGEGRTMELSSYSEMGLEYIKPMVAKMREKFPKVKVVESSLNS